MANRKLNIRKLLSIEFNVPDVEPIQAPLRAPHVSPPIVTGDYTYQRFTATFGYYSGTTGSGMYMSGVIG